MPRRSAKGPIRSARNPNRRRRRCQTTTIIPHNPLRHRATPSILDRLRNNRPSRRNRKPREANNRRTPQTRFPPTRNRLRPTARRPRTAPPRRERKRQRKQLRKPSRPLQPKWQPRTAPPPRLGPQTRTRGRRVEIRQIGIKHRLRSHQPPPKKARTIPLRATPPILNRFRHNRPIPPNSNGRETNNRRTPQTRFPPTRNRLRPTARRPRTAPPRRERKRQRNQLRKPSRPLQPKWQPRTAPPPRLGPQARTRGRQVEIRQIRIKRRLRLHRPQLKTPRTIPLRATLSILSRFRHNRPIPPNSNGREANNRRTVPAWLSSTRDRHRPIRKQSRIKTPQRQRRRRRKQPRKLNQWLPLKRCRS